MNIEFNIWSFLAFFASFGALVVSFLSFRRGRRIESENHFYKVKLEAYSKILGEIDRLTWFLYDAIQKANKPHLFNLSAKDVDILADTIDDKIYSFSYLLVDYSFYISDKVDKKLSLILDHLFEHDEDMNLDNYKTYHNKMNQLSNELDIAMREDLQIELLHRKLFERMSDSTIFRKKIKMESENS